MKDTIKKIMTAAMLLSFAVTTPVSALAAANGDLLAYSLDYMPEIRGSQPSVVSLEANQGITNKTLPVTLSLRDSDVKQVLRMFADKAGLNIIFKGDIKGSVTMDLVNIPLNSAFNMVMESQNLAYTLKDNTLLIASGASAAAIGKNEMAILPVKYVNAAQMAHFLNANIYGMNKPGLSNTYIASVNPATNEIIIFGSENDVKLARNVIAQLDKKPVITTFKVNHSTPAQMADMICKMLLPGTGAFSGGTTGGAASLSDIYTDAVFGGVLTGAASEEGASGSSIELGAGAIACSSAITNSGSKSSSSSSGEESSEVVSFNSVGITVAYYTQMGTVTVTGATPQQIDMIREYIATSDTRQPQAYIEFSIIELNESGTREFDNQWAFYSKHFNFQYDGDPASGKTYSPENLTYKFGGQRAFTDKKQWKDAKWRQWTTGSPTLLYNLSMIMQNGKGRTISNPRILATNGKESVIDLSEDYVKTVKSEFMEQSAFTGPQIQRTYEIADDLGLKIAVTPFISPDGYVYLNVKPEYSTIKDPVYYKGVTGENELGATLLARNNLDLKNIRLKDGETLVIGGMMRETEEKDVSKIPFLGDIPGLGTFFRSSKVVKSKRELIILITPKIVTDTEEPTATL